MGKFIIYGSTDDIRKQRVLEYLKKTGDSILYTVDSHPDKWDSDKKVFSPQKILENPDVTIICLSPSSKAITGALREMGVKNRINFYPMWDSFFCADTSIDYFENKRWIIDNEEEIRELYEMDDAITSSTIEVLIDERKKGKFEFICNDKLDEYEFVPYFGEDTFYPKGKVTFLDAGAYTGDTIDSLRRKNLLDICKIYAFEPDHGNYKTLKSYVEESGISDITEVINAGLWDKDTHLQFVSDGLTSYVKEIEKSETPTDLVKVYKADDVVKNVIGTLCIKMDIEGSETKAIKGCRSLIQDNKPYMAICVYHRMTDIIQIPSTIKSICSDYRFYLRAGYHTVLYAVPK